jgi:hypothetical protein
VGTGENTRKSNRDGGASHADPQRLLTQRSINHDPGYAPKHIMIVLVQEHQTFVTRRHPFSARLCVAVAAMVESGYGERASLPF